MSIEVSLFGGPSEDIVTSSTVGDAWVIVEEVGGDDRLVAWCEPE